MASCHYLLNTSYSKKIMRLLLTHIVLFSSKSRRVHHTRTLPWPLNGNRGWKSANYLARPTTTTFPTSRKSRKCGSSQRCGSWREGGRGNWRKCESSRLGAYSEMRFLPPPPSSRFIFLQNWIFSHLVSPFLPFPLPFNNPVVWEHFLQNTWGGGATQD